MIDPATRILIDEFWHLIAHRSELQAPRDFVRVDIGDEEVAAFNDGTSVVVFDNACPHRGARIFDGNAGNQRFLCRYHGWSYANGRVRCGNVTFLDPEAPRPVLATWQLQWMGDWLFAARQPRMSLEDQLGTLAEELAALSGDLVERIDTNAYSYECDWRIALENALEPYHVGAIHPETLDTLKLDRGVNDFVGLNSVWRTSVTSDRVRKGLERIGTMFDLRYQHRGYISFYVFPFAMISSTYGLSYSVQNFFPSAKPDRANFVSRLLRARLKSEDKRPIVASFFEDTARLNRQVFEEDHQICRRVPARSWSTSIGHLTEAEEKVARFRQAVAEVVQRG